MTPKEKAEKFLYDSYKELGNIENLNPMNKAKQLALIAVDEILNAGKDVDEFCDSYWQEVRKEIKNL